jgi:zinc transporter, ZIP family
VLGAIGWGTVAASSLVIGALLGIARGWPSRLVGVVLAFGGGALISAVSFDLAEEGAQIGSGTAVATGLACGALTYYFADRLLDRMGHARQGPSGMAAGAAATAAATGTALALGAFLDGIPEQMVLGIGLAGGEGVSVGLLVAIFVSNLPEGVGSAIGMRSAGTRSASIIRLWIIVAACCMLATVAGYAIADNTGGNFQAFVDGFAAGALLVMLVDSMIPEAARRAGRVGGLVTVLGFAVAAALSALS